MTRPTRCPKCGGKLVTAYKTFEVDGHRAENVPVLICPKCNIFLANIDLFMNITERTEDFKDKDQLLEELREIKKDEEIKDILKQYKFQNHIREILNEKGMSLRRIAYIMGVSANYIHMLTKNQTTSIRTALKLAYALGVDINDLYTLEKESYNMMVAETKTLYIRSNEKTKEYDEKIKKELEEMKVKVYIEKVIKEKGITKTQLATRLDMSPQELYNIIHYRKDSTGIETALKMAYALETNVNELFKLEKVKK